ncbi:hypothetical protein EJ02DRAFT_507664 [Clathrospora elynae]|uniref:Uncharacterized protein n=1 Tax=Clathrospora elynae TaxID=706981 RepID=A0A6A5T4F5_9PLEO|nr:hypothetical protein EJ02DRAFT_507664 [Clathrospora elynae]
MPRPLANPKVPRKSSRYDSGFLSDEGEDSFAHKGATATGTASSPPAVISNFKAGFFEDTDWDFGAARTLSKMDLQLRLPHGFPIVPLPSTLAQARTEAEAGAGDELAFDIYEDGDDDTTQVPADATVATSTANMPPAVVDSQGLTLAASNRRKSARIAKSAASRGALGEVFETAAEDSKKRKRGAAHSSDQPKPKQTQDD